MAQDAARSTIFGGSRRSMSSDNLHRIFRDIEDLLEFLELPDACKFESMELFEIPEERDIDSEWEPSKWVDKPDP